MAQCDRQRPHAKVPPITCDQLPDTLLQATSEPKYLTNAGLSTSLTDPQTARPVGGAMDGASVGSRPSGNNGVSHQQQCGTPSCPWKLVAQPGQRINLTLIHFSTTSVEGSRTVAASQNQNPPSDRTLGGAVGGSGISGGVACHRFAAVSEPASTVGGAAAMSSYRDLTACGNDRRRTSTEADDLNSSATAWQAALARGIAKNEKQLYWSDSNSLRLEFFPPHGVHVIIRYQGRRKRTSYLQFMLCQVKSQDLVFECSSAFH